jgi:hypothetical protein
VNIFGNVHLGYVVIETVRFADWRRFGRDAIGMHLDETLPDVLRFRLDDNECRFLLQRGPAEDVTALGWHIEDHRTFDEILGRVSGHGVPVAEGRAEETALRGVERLVRFPGPNGMTQEIFTRARSSDTALDMGVDGGFVTVRAVSVMSRSPPRSLTSYTATTALFSTPAYPTTSTRPSTVSSSRSGSCGSTNAITRWRSPR